MKARLDLNQFPDATVINDVKSLIENGSIKTLEITGDGPFNSVAVGRLLNVDPSILTSSQDVPLVIELDFGNAACATFGGVRFLGNQRLLNWLDIIQEGDSTNADSDNAPSTEVLPHLHKPEGATA